MKLFMLFLYVGILSLPLLAQRVIVTKTANKHNLKPIHAKLQTLHIKMYVKKYKNYYFIYTKEYQTKDRAEINLRKVQTLFPSAKLERKKKIEKKEEEIALTSQKERKWIVGVGIGSSSIKGDIDQKISFNDSGTTYSLKVGYFLKKYLLSTLSYSSSSVKQTTISNFYFSENYYHNIAQNSNIYIGALLGYSSLIITSEHSTPSGSAMYGMQIGVSYDMFGYIPLSLSYQGIFLNHTISFTSTTQTRDINTNFQNVVELGIAYKF